MCIPFHSSLKRTGRDETRRDGKGSRSWSRCGFALLSAEPGREEGERERKREAKGPVAGSARLKGNEGWNGGPGDAMRCCLFGWMGDLVVGGLAWGVRL